MTKFSAQLLAAVTSYSMCASAPAQESVDDLLQRGEELFHADIGCRVCHADTGEGLVGPSLHFGPTPVDIFDQLERLQDKI